MRRAAFALRFGSLDPLISGQVTSKTKLLMERDIRARVTKLAPFLQFDADPYPVVLGDKTVWVIDGYTTHRHVPVLAGDRAARVGSSATFNYVRNSVKVTVDAYQGTVTFYVFDQKDPIIQAWRRGVPRPLHRRLARCPTSSQAHLRYPEDLFKVAGRPVRPLPRHRAEAVLRRQRASGWSRPTPAPASIGSDSRSAPTRRRSEPAERQPQAATSTGKRIDPVLPVHPSCPVRTTEHFVVIAAVRAGVVGQQPDAPRVVPRPRSPIPGSYGKLESFVMPQGRRCTARCRSNNADQPDAGDLAARSRCSNQQGSQRHPGEPAAHPGRQLDPLRAAVLRRRVAGDGAFPQFQFVVVLLAGLRRGAAARRCRTALDQLLGVEHRPTVRRAARVERDGTGTVGDHDHRRRPPRHGRPVDHDAAADHHDAAGDAAAPRTCSTRPPTTLDQAAGRRSTTSDLGDVPAASSTQARDAGEAGPAPRPRRRSAAA